MFALHGDGAIGFYDPMARFAFITPIEGGK